MATLEASQVNAFATADFRTMNPQQRMLYAQQQNYVKVYKLGGPSSKRREYAKYFHKSVITPATLTKEFDMEVDYLVDQFNVRDCLRRAARLRKLTRCPHAALPSRRRSCCGRSNGRR